jgi:hypothetical protein
MSLRVSSLALFSLLFVASEARAWVCTPVQNVNPPLTQAWNQRCIPYYISREGSLLGGDERRRLIANGFAQWSKSLNPCTDIEFVDAGYTDGLSGFNPGEPSEQKNVIASVERADQLGAFPDGNLLAITLTSYSVETGEIFDADILFNAVNSKFEEVEGGCNRQTGAFDISNTLVHELGHLLGFDHETKQESTMFASAERCEVKKRDLSDDDKMGLCSVYGAGMPVMTCAAPADYDAAQGKPERFRDQCERLSDNGGCDCTSNPAREEAGPWSVLCWSFLAVGSVVFATRKR